MSSVSEKACVSRHYRILLVSSHLRSLLKTAGVFCTEKGKKAVGDNALIGERSIRHDLLQPQSQSLGLPSAASRFSEMLPTSSCSWAQTIFLHCQKPHHQSLTNSCSGRIPSPWTHGTLWAYTSTLFSCGWDDSLMYVTGTLWWCDTKGRCYRARSTRSGVWKPGLASQFSTYWLIGPGGWPLWFQHNLPWASHLTSLSLVSSKGNGDNSCYSYLTKLLWSLNKSKRDK